MLGRMSIAALFVVFIFILLDVSVSLCKLQGNVVYVKQQYEGMKQLTGPVVQWFDHVPMQNKVRMVLQ